MFGIYRYPKGSRTDKLKNCTSNCYQTSQVGVEYESPNQQGGIYGRIFRQFFIGSLPADLTSGAAVSKLIDYALSVDDASVRHVIHGWFSDGTDEAKITLSGASGAGDLALSATGLTVQAGWVDYTKV